MARDGLTFTAAVRRLADGEGIERSADPARIAAFKAQSAARQRQAEAEAAQAAERGVTKARAIWRAAQADAPGLRAYLDGRGISLQAIGGVPPTLRLHPDLAFYQADDEGRQRVVHRGPAMVGFIGRARLAGVHLTWLDAADPARGRARFTTGEKIPKKFRGRTGEIFGQPVVLAEPRGALVVVGEGIETTLAVLSATRLRNPAFTAQVEAALSLGALAGPEGKGARGKSARTGKRLPSPLPDADAPRPGWMPPEGVTRATICADPSARCPETARLHAERALAKIGAACAQGARLAIPRGHWDHDDDFADLAQQGELGA
jgi:hypothetical protein